MAISLKTIFKEKENIDGLTEECILVSGLTIKWRALEHLLGVMEENMLANIKTIRNMVPELLNGQMVESISVNGKMESSTEREIILKKAKIEEVYGKWAKESTGSKTND